MKLQLNTDSHVQHDPSVQRHVETAIEHSLGRFRDQISRVEVHLSDVNGGKPGSDDKRCLIEARIEGRPPVTASDDADTVKAAVDGAARKMQRVLDSALGKLHQ